MSSRVLNSRHQCGIVDTKAAINEQVVRPESDLEHHASLKSGSGIRPESGVGIGL